MLEKKLENLRKDLFKCLETIEKYQALKLKNIDEKWRFYIKMENIVKVAIEKEIFFYGETAIEKRMLILKNDDGVVMRVCYYCQQDSTLQEVEYSRVNPKFENFIKELLDDEDQPLLNIVNQIQYSFEKNLIEKITTDIEYK